MMKHSLSGQIKLYSWARSSVSLELKPKSIFRKYRS
jgi:hypothetical protein